MPATTRNAWKAQIAEDAATSSKAQVRPKRAITSARQRAPNVSENNASSTKGKVVGRKHLTKASKSGRLARNKPNAVSAPSKSVSSSKRVSAPAKSQRPPIKAPPTPQCAQPPVLKPPARKRRKSTHPMDTPPVPICIENPICGRILAEEERVGALGYFRTLPSHIIAHIFDYLEPCQFKQLRLLNQAFLQTVEGEDCFRPLVHVMRYESLVAGFMRLGFARADIERLYTQVDIYPDLSQRMTEPRFEELEAMHLIRLEHARQRRLRPDIDVGVQFLPMAYFNEPRPQIKRRRRPSEESDEDF